MVDATQSFSLDRQDKLPIFGVFATTFRIFGKAPLVFILCALVTQIPTIGRLVLTAPTSTTFTAAIAVVTILNLLILFFVQTCMTYIAFRLYDDQSTSPGDALRLGARRYLPMLGTTLLVMLAIYGGMFLLIVPGIILSCVYAVASPVCALESTGPIASMKRSGFLTKNTRWRIFGVYLLFFLPFFAITGSVTYLLTRQGHGLLAQWLSLGCQIPWVPLATIFSTAIYVELRRLKEHVGLARVFD